MTNSSSFDFCIFGAGLAGVSLAKSLIEQQVSVCLIDSGDIASGASGTPLGLINPATGRFGTKTWKAEKCLNATLQNLEEIQESAEQIFYKNTGILRPAMDEKIASRMKENAENSAWLPEWCLWLDEKDILDLNPDINCVDGGLWLPVGLTVDVSTYLSSAVEVLKQKGLTVFARAEYSLKQTEKTWSVTLNNKGENISSAHIIHTAGIDTATTSLWDFLPLNPVKGQTIELETNHDFEFDYSISALGYIASISKRRFILGSTYEHHFDHREPDEDGLNYLRERMKKVYPSLIEQSKIIGQWAGVRASTPNRKPILGPHPDWESSHVFTGLGSKGLMYSAYLSTLFSKYLLEGKTLPEEISIDRL